MYIEVFTYGISYVMYTYMHRSCIYENYLFVKAQAVANMMALRRTLVSKITRSSLGYPSEQVQEQDLAEREPDKELNFQVMY